MGFNIDSVMAKYPGLKSVDLYFNGAMPYIFDTAYLRIKMTVKVVGMY